MIDLRSDTVTRPTDAMRAVMLAADVGDDVYGDDPTVNALQQYTADMFGKEAGLYVPSGTQSNLVAMLTHCQRGDEYITGQEQHTYRFEGGGAAVFGSIQPQPLNNQADGSLDLGEIEAAIKPPDFHFARTRLLTLENTIGGRVLPMTYLSAFESLARRRGLATHLDGARICNAAVKLGVTLPELVTAFDSVSVCLSKSLGAPVGTVLIGERGFIEEAKRYRKMLGGGMRQAGILAAGGLYALQNNIPRLVEDHENALLMAKGMAEVEEIKVHMPQTNIFYCDIDAKHSQALTSFMRENGVLMRMPPHMRIVTHMDITRADVHRVVELTKQYFAKHA